jgi:hypothetical protein
MLIKGKSKDKTYLMLYIEVEESKNIPNQDYDYLNYIILRISILYKTERRYDSIPSD